MTVNLNLTNINYATFFFKLKLLLNYKKKLVELTKFIFFILLNKNRII